MRFLHTSDWHLGISFGMTSLKEDQKCFIRQLFEVIKKEKIDAVLLSGDVYDSSVSNSEAIGLYNDAVNGICNDLKVPMIVIAGNHDGAARLASCRELLSHAGLYVTGKLTENLQPVVIGDVAFYSIPYFNIDEVRALFPEKSEEIRSYEDAMKLLCGHILEQADDSKKKIVLSHAFVVGAALSDSDRSAQVGTATAVSKEVFDGFDYVALGHIHRPQDLSDRVRYCGSPLVYSFGIEETYEKSFTIVDTATMEQEKVPIVPLHAVTTISGSYTEIMELPESQNYLKVEIGDRFIGLETLAALKTKFPNLIEARGKSFSVEEGETTITVDEISKMSENDIANSFFQEIYSCEMTSQQKRLIEDALEELERRGDKS